jgi:hypothetical protein
MNDFSAIIAIGSKAVVLLLIALYFIFSTLIFLNVRRLNTFVSITYSYLSTIIPLLFLIHLLLVLSLFFIALVIL